MSGLRACAVRSGRRIVAARLDARPVTCGDLQPELDLGVVGLGARRRRHEPDDRHGHGRSLGGRPGDDAVGAASRDRLGEPREHPVARGSSRSSMPPSSRRVTDRAPLARALHLGADGVGEQHPTADLVADRRLEHAALASLRLGELAAAVGDAAQHRRGDAVRVGEPHAALEEVGVLRGLPGGRLTLGLGVAAGLACGGGERARRACARCATHTMLPITPSAPSESGPAQTTVCTASAMTPSHAATSCRRAAAIVMSVPTAATYQVA